MEGSTATKETHEAHAHEELGFVRTYIFSTDHKMIGKQFLFLGLFMMIIGGGLALMLRWQLGYPEEPLPLVGVSQEFLSTDEPQTAADRMWQQWDEEGTENWMVETMPYGVMTAAFYNMVFTMHATIMIFFVIMPILVGCFGNFLIPLMLGARDMAFPKLNMASFWVGAVSGIVMLAGFFVTGGHASTGWTAYAPLSSNATWTGVDWGQNLWCISIIILAISSMMGAINYITTTINMRAPGMTLMRMPLVIWSLFIVAILLLLALPVLTSALALLLFDRMGGTSFFSPAGGGEPLLWQHLFWFFGHPEVYVLIVPAMGITSDVLSVFSRKPVFGYHAMVYAMVSLALLSWVVWGHHMFMSGMNPALGMAFMLSTMVIAVPSAIKTFNWLGTIWGGSIQFTTPMLNALAFVAMFVIGGLSGIHMAITPVDIFIHDTYYIVAHIHYVVFGGSVFGLFAGLYFWFPKMFGRLMNESLGKIHFWLTFIFFNCTFIPMHLIGVGGHMRRIYNPMQYEFLQPMQPMNEFITVSAFCLGAAQLVLVYNFCWSLYRGKKAEHNPWQANTLEWGAPSPPPHLNWGETIPSVYRGPYEYSSPEVTEDWLPQDKQLQQATAGGGSD